MFDWFRKKSSALTLARTELPDAPLNEALSAYVKTFPQRERLVAFISSNNLTNHASEIETKLNKAIKDAEDFLHNQPNGVQWSEEFNNLLFATSVRLKSEQIQLVRAERCFWKFGIRLQGA